MTAFLYPGPSDGGQDPLRHTFLMVPEQSVWLPFSCVRHFNNYSSFSVLTLPVTLNPSSLTLYFSQPSAPLPTLDHCYNQGLKQQVRTMAWSERYTVLKFHLPNKSAYYFKILPQNV